MSDSLSGNLSAEEMAEFLRLYLDETGEQLDALVETLLGLEAEPASVTGLNEAFRLIHSIKGSSALLGLDRITALTHHLESHFERLRSGRQQLDTVTMNVVLRCIDFLRECNQSLRSGQPMASVTELLDEVQALEQASSRAAVPPSAKPPAPGAAARPADSTPPAAERPIGEPAADPVAAVVVAEVAIWRVHVRFRDGLALTDMKADLVLARLSRLGTIVDAEPPRDALAAQTALAGIEVILQTPAAPQAIAEAARAEGVDDVRLEPAAADARATAVVSRPAGPVAAADTVAAAPPAPAGDRGEAAERPAGEKAAPPAAVSAIAETVRVDVDRLDVLLNLAGELVVTRARLTQLAGEMAPAFKKSGLAARMEEVADAVRGLQEHAPVSRELLGQLELLEQQTRLWDSGRAAFGRLSAAIDELTRVSNGLQRGVLEARMVPVGPLFNRFKRSVRDIAQELGKQVRLELAGEKTELDKRMIDEIGDPLNHLIRNCVDHGIEPAEVRAARGKPAVATVRLAAAHRGNNVFITVEDDGGGIDVARVRALAVERGLVAGDVAAALGEEELIDLIFEPGFSTAARVSDISGRGVGMDIVRTRIGSLNGTVEVESRAGQGTRFTIRLPLTLTITSCMLFRLPQGVVAVPIENVREIVPAKAHQTVRVEGRRLVDVRGEFLPLVGIDDLFRWPAAPTVPPNVAILHSNNRAVGLRVDELLGGQDLVVKPLDENFVHIRGLGGASILGDGTVCLLLDTTACLELARRGGAAPGIAP